jgi:hypothetical protein
VHAGDNGDDDDDDNVTVVQTRNLIFQLKTVANLCQSPPIILHIHTQPSTTKVMQTQQLMMSLGKNIGKI